MVGTQQDGDGIVVPWVAIQPNGLGGGGLVGCGRHFVWLGGRVGMLIMDGKVGGGRQVRDKCRWVRGREGSGNGIMECWQTGVCCSDCQEKLKAQNSKKVKQVSRRPGSIKCINVHFFQIF